MDSLPLMLQFALLLLGCALSRYLWNISITVASVVVGVTSLGVIFYLFIIVAGTVFESCPYQTPGSRIFRHLGPKVWHIIHLVHSAITSALRKTFKQSRAVETVVLTAHVHHPWWSKAKIFPFLADLVTKVPLEFVIDVYNLGRAATHALFTVPVGIYHLIRSASNRLRGIYSTLRQRLGRQMTPSHLRCISWTLQTSLDKPVHLTTLIHLATTMELTGLDPALVTDCFNVFAGCVIFSDHKLVIVQGLEQLATISIRCFFRTLHHLSVAHPTSMVSADLRRRFKTIFPSEFDFTDSPFNSTIVMTRILIGPARNHRNIQWQNYRPPSQEHILFSQYMVQAARVGYQRTRSRKVPRWILRFALQSLSLDPRSPTSVVADCLTIIAIDLDCDVSNVTTSNERCVLIQWVPTFLTKSQWANGTGFRPPCSEARNHGRSTWRGSSSSVQIQGYRYTVPIRNSPGESRTAWDG